MFYHSGARHRWPLVWVLILSLGLVGGGVLLATLKNLAACPLCILQRMLYLLLALEALLGLAMLRHRAGRLLAWLLVMLTAATGAFVAGYQTWLQRWATNTSCGADMAWWERLVQWAGKQVPVLFEASGLCSDPAWRFLSLSIAEWSLVIFAGLLLTAGTMVWRNRQDF